MDQTQKRPARENDFTVPVDGVGSFRFGRRTMRDELDIGVEFSLMTRGIGTPTASLSQVAGWLATLKVMTVTAPDGWDIDAMDPLDEDTYAKLMKAYMAFRQKEDSFRSGKEQAGKE